MKRRGKAKKIETTAAWARPPRPPYGPVRVHAPRADECGHLARPSE